MSRPLKLLRGGDVPIPFVLTDTPYTVYRATRAHKPLNDRPYLPDGRLVTLDSVADLDLTSVQ